MSEKSGLITIPTELMDALDAEAANEKRSRSGQIEVILAERYNSKSKPRTLRRPAKTIPAVNQQ